MLRALGSQSPATNVQESASGLAASLELTPGNPNPFTSRTTLRLNLPEASYVTASIYDLAGRPVRRLLDGNLPAQERILVWDGRDDAAREVPSSVYFVRVTSAGDALSRRLVLVR